MKRTFLNALIDAVAFAVFLLLLSTGMVLQYQLPPGSGGRQGFGTGHGTVNRSVEVLWGWTRHEWGQVHYWIAFLLMAVLAFHLLLHWKWIVGVVRGKPSNASPYRLALGCVGLVSACCLAAIPMATPTTTISRSELQDQQRSQLAREPKDSSVDNTHQESARDDDESGNTSLSVRGLMTLQEIANQTGTPVSQIIEALGLPKDTDPTEQAGRLLRGYGLQMSDLRHVLGPSPSLDTPSGTIK